MRTPKANSEYFRTDDVEDDLKRVLKSGDNVQAHRNVLDLPLAVQCLHAVMKFGPTLANLHAKPRPVRVGVVRQWSARAIGRRGFEGVKRVPEQRAMAGTGRSGKQPTVGKGQRRVLFVQFTQSMHVANG